MILADKIKIFTHLLPPNIRHTIAMRLRYFFKIPMLTYIRPTVVDLSNERVEIKIPLFRRSKNHLGSMYFGALAAGADFAAGTMLVQHLNQSHEKISAVIKDFKADFLKRPEADTHFICDDGKVVAEMISETIQSGKRVNQTIHVIAKCPKITDSENVATFDLTLSVKKVPAKSQNQPQRK